MKNDFDSNNYKYKNPSEEVAASCMTNDHCAEVDTKIHPLTEQSHVFPTVIHGGNVYVKIPVLLAETNITIPVESTITLDQPAIEIKRIRKNVFLTQSRLIPRSEGPLGNPLTAILFIEGFVRKNIEYATQSCPANGVSENVCGDIRHCTVQVPFHFSTRIDVFRRPPVFENNTTPEEFEFFTDKLEGCDRCADPVIGRNPCDQSFFFTEFFNEKPFTELVRADIAEVDIHHNPMSSCCNPTEQSFTEITEKIVVNLTLKVLQNQQVLLSAVQQ